MTTLGSSRAHRVTLLNDRPPGQVLIHEIYRSIQGESTFAGLPCVFVRFAVCDARCQWCDTPHAFHQGTPYPLEAVVEKVQNSSYNSRDEGRAYMPGSTLRALTGAKYVNNFVYQPVSASQSEAVTRAVRGTLALAFLRLCRLSPDWTISTWRAASRRRPNARVRARYGRRSPRGAQSRIPGDSNRSYGLPAVELTAETATDL